MDDRKKQSNIDLARKLLAEQNFTAAVIGGAVATLLAAFAYGLAAATWPVSYGFAMAAVGLVVGLSIGFLGRGISMKFAVLATVYTIVGYLLGNWARLILELARATATSPLDVLRNNTLPALLERSANYLSAGDLVYLLVAISGAAFLARRSLSRSEYFAIRVFQERE